MYWANHVEVQRLAVEAWIAHVRGNRDDALTAMRAAADLEDSMEKHIVTPGAIVPARELLGDMLLEAHRPQDALVAYKASAQREPRRLHGLYGVARAAEQTGDKDLARTSYSMIVDMTAGSNAVRKEIREAKAYLATQ